MDTAQASYKSALRWPCLTQFYDQVMGLTMREDRFRSMLIESIRIRNPHYILDVGCGTGTQTLLLHKAFPRASVFGLDGDWQALAIAERKQAKVGWPVLYELGLSTALPYPDGSMNVVTSSLLFHHLSDANKVKSIREISRVLQPDGEVVIADWGKPTSTLMRVLFYGLQLFDGFDTTSANVRGLLPHFLRNNDFRQITESGSVNTVFGTLTIYHAHR